MRHGAVAFVTATAAAAGKAEAAAAAAEVGRSAELAGGIRDNDSGKTLEEICSRQVSWDPQQSNLVCNRACRLGQPLPPMCREEQVHIEEENAIGWVDGVCFEQWVPGTADYKLVLNEGEAVISTHPADCQTACQFWPGCVYFVYQIGIPPADGKSDGMNCLLKSKEQMWDAIEADVSELKDDPTVYDFCPLETIEYCNTPDGNCLQCFGDTKACVRYAENFISGPLHCARKTPICDYGHEVTEEPTISTTSTTGPDATEPGSKSNIGIILGAAGGAAAMAASAQAAAHLIRRRRAIDVEPPQSSNSSGIQRQNITEDSYI